MKPDTDTTKPDPLELCLWDDCPAGNKFTKCCWEELHKCLEKCPAGKTEERKCCNNCCRKFAHKYRCSAAELIKAYC